MLPYILGFSFVAALAALIFSLIGKGKPISAAIVTFFITLVMNWVALYFFMPDFSFFPGGGWATGFFVNMTVAAIVSVAVTFTQDQWNNLEINYKPGSIIATLTVIIFLVWGVYMTWGFPGGPCDNAGKDQIAAMFPVENANSAVPETNLDDLMAISPSNAIMIASRSIGSDANIGSYLTVNQAPLQHVGDELTYPVDFKVTNWTSFKAAGYVVPGYVNVSGSNINAPAPLVTGYAMKYVPEAQWNHDLYRHIYLTYLLPNRIKLDDNWNSLEVDDTGKPFYTATTLRYANGWRAKLPSGVIVIDPETGQIDSYPLDQVPEWVDVIWSKDLVKTYADYYATYTNWDECKIGVGQTGKLKIDEVNDVIGKHDQAYQVTFTSVGKDQSATELVLFDPRAGTGKRYTYNGPILQAIDATVTAATVKLLPGVGYESEECEIHWLLNEPVAYCILSSHEVTEDGGRQFGGYAFLPTRLSNQNDAVALGSNLEEAYNDLMDKLAAAPQDTNLAESMQTTQIVGTVSRMASVDQYTYLMLEGDNVPPDRVYRASVNDPVLALTQVGDAVTLTVRDIPYQGFYNIIDITNPVIPIK